MQGVQYSFDAWASSSLEVGIILVRDLVQVWAITAPSQPSFPLTRHSLTVLARHSLRQWHRRVWSCLVDVRAVLVVSAYVVISQGLCNTHQGRRAAHERSARPMATKSSHYFNQTPYPSGLCICAG